MESKLNISINVPSHKRAHMLDTFRILPSAIYWVHRGEENNYRRFNRGINLRALPDKTKGNVAAVRNQILREQFRNPKNHAVLMVDDDVQYIGFWEEKKQVRIEKEKELLEFVRKYADLAMQLGIRLWGVNFAPDKQNYREYTPFSMLSYVSASFSCFLKGNDLLYDERFSLKEDYDMTIQQLNKYRKVLRVNKAFYQKKGAEQTGGCAFYRNVDKEIEQIDLLQKKWGKGIVRNDLGKSRSHSTKKERKFDINPIIRVPIAGV